MLDNPQAEWAPYIVLGDVKSCKPRTEDESGCKKKRNKESQ